MSEICFAYRAGLVATFAANPELPGGPAPAPKTLVCTMIAASQRSRP